MSHFVDPSWCARLHAARSSAAPPNVPAAPAEPERSVPPEAVHPGSAQAVPAPLFIRREIPTVHDCELCGTVMYDHHCKIVCPNCGYKRDCSDP